MAKLTQKQADDLYGDCEISRIDDNGFKTYIVDGILDGDKYRIDTTESELSLDENSTPVQIKAATIIHWKTKEKIEKSTVTATPVSKV